MIKKLFLCMLLTSIPIAAYSKRMAPPKVQPVVYGGIRYEASTVPMGYILAYDSKTGKLLWEKKLYDVDYNEKFEKDIQDIFIKQLKLENGDADMLLIATDERERSYKVDLRDPQPDFSYKEALPEEEVWNPDINCGIPSSDFVVIFENGFNNEEVNLLVDNKPVFSQVITSAKNGRAYEDLKLKKDPIL